MAVQRYSNDVISVQRNKHCEMVAAFLWCPDCALRTQPVEQIEIESGKRLPGLKTGKRQTDILEGISVGNHGEQTKEEKMDEHLGTVEQFCDAMW